MTDERINIVIGEQCGVIADYCNDLNAMHEAEKHLNTRELWEAYKAHLLNWMTEPICATARQRSEAFLRTISKWEENQQ